MSNITFDVKCIRSDPQAGICEPPSGTSSFTPGFANIGKSVSLLLCSEISELLDNDGGTTQSYPVWNVPTTSGKWNYSFAGNLNYVSTNMMAEINSYVQWTGVNFPVTGNYQLRMGVDKSNSRGTWSILVDGTVVDTQDFYVVGGIGQIGNLIWNLGNVSTGSHNIRIQLVGKNMSATAYNGRFLGEFAELVLV